MFENYKNCLEVTQVENKIKYLEENKIDIDNIKENYKEFTKKKKRKKEKISVKKIQQRFKSERYIAVIEEINKRLL